MTLHKLKKEARNGKVKRSYHVTCELGCSHWSHEKCDCACHKHTAQTVIEAAVEELEKERWTKDDCPISKMEYEMQGVEFMRGKVEGHNQAITAAQERLQALIKESV